MANGVRIDPELRDYIPKPSSQERETLEEKLVAEGCTEKFTAWDNDPDNPGGLTMVDGHTRYDICERKGIGYSFRRMSFASKDHAKLWMLRNQAGRRNYTDDQRAVFALRASELAGEIAKRDRAVVAVRSREVKAGRSEPILSAQSADKIVTPKPKTDNRAAAAKKERVSLTKVRNVAAVRKAKPELVEKIASGEVTLREAKKVVESEKMAAAKPPPVEGAPPWAEFTGTIDGFVSELRSVGLRLGKALDYDSETKRLQHPYAHFFTHAGTVGAVNAIARTLRDNVPAAESPKPPGYIPSRVVEARESVDKK